MQNKHLNKRFDERSDHIITNAGTSRNFIVVEYKSTKIFTKLHNLKIFLFVDGALTNYKLDTSI